MASIKFRKAEHFEEFAEHVIDVNWSFMYGLEEKKCKFV